MILPREPRSVSCRPAVRIWCAFLIVMGILLSLRNGRAQWGEADVAVIEPLATGQINWTDNVVRNQDRAAAQRSGTQASARQTTLQTAIQKARQGLHTVLAQMHFDSSTTVGTVLQSQAEGTQRLDDLVQAAAVVETVYLASGEIRSTVQMPLTGRLLAVLLPRSVATPPGSAPAASGTYTGIVIDARGLGLQPALFPRIVDEQSQAIYDPTMVDLDVAMQRGYIAYAKTHEHAVAKARIGEQPLVLRARRVLSPSRIDVVLPSADAAQIRDYAGTQALLRRCQILIVM